MSKANFPGVKNVLSRKSPLKHANFQPNSNLLPFLRDRCRVLIVGAGGLGCELLKNLVLMGFGNIDIIDMDRIDLTNLNRQFLFRESHIGQFKAEIAACCINNKYGDIIFGGDKTRRNFVTPHCCRIEDYEPEFYSKFDIIVCGLDSIAARRWMNNVIISLLEYEQKMSDENGNSSLKVIPSSIIPMVDGGSEGLKGNVRVIIPSMTPCFECTIDLYPPQVDYPLCTLANTPRLPEHCIEWVRILLWPKENPFSKPIDGDDPTHIMWIMEKSKERAKHFTLDDHAIDYKLTQGVIKHIIPAVASTNAMIAGQCALEVFKLATSCVQNLNNFMVMNIADSLYTYSYEAEVRPDCLACSQNRVKATISLKTGQNKLRDVIDVLKEDVRFQMRSPGLTCEISGKCKTLYISSVKSLEESTRCNLNKSLSELGLQSGCELIVVDKTTSPHPSIIKLCFQ